MKAKLDADEKQPTGPCFTVAVGEDGLPVIRTENGVITSRQVKELESQIS